MLFFSTLKMKFIVFALVITQICALSKNQLYPYKESATLQLESNGNIASAEHQLQTPIKLFGKEYKTIFINANGVLSFTRPMNRFYNIPFPLDDPSIAPLYSHVDTRGSGKIYYQETNSTEITQKASRIVQTAFKDARGFTPKSVFLATWWDVGYFENGKDKVNTFQVVISSNDTHTYVEFLYPENGIQWIQAESHPNGLPDAKAQAGVMGENKFFTLSGSGKDQIQHIDKWSNVYSPGEWVYQVGPLKDDQNVLQPDNFEAIKDRPVHCNSGGSIHCHSKASCNDHEKGFCCKCEDGFYGNGKSCQAYDAPLRITGKLFGKVNDKVLEDHDVQCYIQTKDGRSYTALVRIPENLGWAFQHLTPINEMIGWLFAKTEKGYKNGYQLTGGVFNHTAEIAFGSKKLTIKSRYLGHDVFGQLKMEIELEGHIPSPRNATEFQDYELLLSHSRAGVINSVTKKEIKIGDASSILINQVIYFDECNYVPPKKEKDDDGTTVKIKFTRGITTFEKNDGIVRFAMNSKIGGLKEEDPCLKASCGPHGTCMPNKETYKCICNKGFQQLHNQNGTSQCVDINECHMGGQVCSPDASCHNTPGSFSCTCNAGFVGDGYSCERTRSCEDTYCDNGGKCVMQDGLPVCECPAGFRNMNNKCVSERSRGSCSQDSDCSPLASCEFNKERQAYSCACIQGYFGDGYECNPDLETIMNGENQVPICQNDLCWCPSGWKLQNNICLREDNIPVDIGSGEVMDYREPCRDNMDCNENERCAYNDRTSRYECSCQPGYNLFDGQCIGVDCSTNPSRCHEKAQCVSMNQDLDVYQCVCIIGYYGDGVKQCIKDQRSCHELSNCGSNAVCAYNQTSSNHVCVCLPGFEGDGYDCMQHSSCQKNPTICSQDATCKYEGGSFTCICKDGYIGDGMSCKPRAVKKTKSLLVNQGMATYKIPFASVDKPGHANVIGFSQMAIAVDVDCTEKKAFVSDVSGKEISSFTFNGSTRNVFMENVDTPEGIAIDWIARAIFWTDPGKKTLEVAHIKSKRRKVLFSKDLVNPRGIAVHPYRGKIFWSDWNRVAPKLEWSNEDGSERRIFLEENIKLPNSLAIDWYTDEICWTDAGTFSINCANIDTKAVRNIIRNLTYPFGLTISQNHYFWTDWKTDKIGVISKNPGEKKRSISALPPGGREKLYGIIFVPENCPAGVSNMCQYGNGGCSVDQLCLPDGRGGRTCVCADNAEQVCYS